jgi:hypothetical protein
MDELTVDKLVAVLQEPKRALLTKVLRTLGVDRTTTILADTLQCEAAGGMRTKKVCISYFPIVSAELYNSN